MWYSMRKERNMKKPISKWNILYVLLALAVLFSLFASPRIVIGVMNASKGKIITVSGNAE